MKLNINFINKSLFAVAALALIGGTANAQGPAPAAREFSYTATGAYETASSLGANGEAGSVGRDSVTEIVVSPYLYVYGNFGAQFTVKGWGAGTYTQSAYENIHLYTNQTVNIAFANFADPVLQSNGADVATPGAGDTIPAEMDVALFKGNGLTGASADVPAGATAIVSSGFKTYAQVNALSNIAATMADSDGHLVLGLKRKITVEKNTKVGTFKNTGRITISRS